jgi:PleD family two-component response regulator
MGGRIGLESKVRVGSIFWFELALQEAREEPIALQISATPHMMPSPVRILLAEDMEINQEIACTVLRAYGHRVDVVTDGIEAVEAVQNITYDMVLKCSNRTAKCK